MKLSLKKTPKKPKPPEVEEVAEVDSYESSDKMVVRFECYPPPGMNQRQCVERLQKFFDYYHPALGLKITKD